MSYREGIVVSGSDQVAQQKNVAKKLGFQEGDVIQEFGYDDDVDHDLREAVEDVVDADLEDEEYDGVVDGVLYWWRDEDGDLVDALVDAQATLAEGGVIWLFTPKPGRDGHVSPTEIEEAAPTAGLHATSSSSAATDWTGTRLVNRRKQ